MRIFYISFLVIIIIIIFSSFEFRLRVSLAADGHLTIISRIRSVNSKPFSFSFAYHTYFSISDIRSVCSSTSSNFQDKSGFGIKESVRSPKRIRFSNVLVVINF